MRMDEEITFQGDVVERSELLNGTESVTLEGASGDGVWTLSGGISWNLGLVDYPGEGDLVLARDEGSEVYASLTTVHVSERDGSEAFEAEYEVDGGTGAWNGASGRITASGAISGESFSGRWHVILESP
jgi:hypothetical protein